MMSCVPFFHQIKSEFVAQLGLKRHYSDTSLVGIGGIQASGSHCIVSIHFRPANKVDFPLLSVTAVIIKRPTAYLARRLNLNNDNNIRLSDDGTLKPLEIDIIFGCDILGQILTGEKLDLGTGGPYALGTIFDFAIFGAVNLLCCQSGDNVETFSGTTLLEAVQRFWRTEEPPMHKIKDPLDIECENLFASTTSRDSNGKYIVRLPIIPNHERLGDSWQTALKQFMSIERRMSRQPEFRDKYVEFMEEYLRLGHMVISEFDFNSGDEYYVLAHHGVFKRSGDVNKIRVVFNGTIPSSTGVCLNDCLYTGERLQNDITDIITNFRFPLVVFTCDVKMMFRQTYICPEDRRYQLIYWRSSPSEPLRVYELTTNTYGLKSSPYIAIRCLHQLAHDGKQDSPRAAELLLRNSYVDDLNGGGDSLSEALSLRDELISLMKSAGYELRKWSSNVPELLQGLPADHLETPRTFDGTDGSVFIKILGIQWDPISDGFTYRVNLPSDSTVTRRSILSMTAKLYDPLGWISPVVFRFKLLLQSVIGTSGNKVDWDSPVSDDLVRMWQDYISDLSNLERLSIPRCLRPGAQARYSLHGFCDGSSLGHAAAVYVRAELPDGSVLVRLIIAKSRLAPLKTQQTIPKMELNGAALLTTLLNHEVSKVADNIVFEEVVGWCDSTIVLAWLRTPAHTLQVFEANRVSQINASTASIHWRHVPSELNCADVSSRGAAAADLLNHELWWGPQWLCQPSDCWPVDGPAFPPDMLPGRKTKTCVVNIGNLQSDTDTDFLIDKFSSFEKLIKVTALVLRFAHLCKNKIKQFPQNISVSERRNAIMHLIRIEQLKHFKDEILCLTNKKTIRTSMRRLNLFMDDDNILRVGGRIGAAELPYDARHPILLSAKSKFTEMLVNHYHIINCHVGANTLAAILSRTYWIMSARRVTRHITYRCVQCYRSKARPTQPYMADLPPDRVRGARPFLGVGTDFAGPFYIKTSTLRNAKITKCYLCIFVCLSVKAVHLEVVSDLTVEAFVAAFARFSNRRGLPTLVRSDCGTNYSGTDKYLKELYIFLRNNRSDIEKRLARDSITWLFNAPSSPNHGGLFEAAVKSAKTHARRVLGETRLTFEELTTFFTKVEAVMNSRPLCPLSTDPTDLEVLTPGHFLIGQPLVALPEYDYTDTKESRLSRFQHVQKMSQHFWSRWKTEYLHTLQQRYKWTSVTEPPKLDDLVLIKEDNLAPLHWKRGRIVKLLPGKDGIVRVAEVKTQNGVLLRPISKLCRLPIEA
ncbi:hypothetical protein JYU34_022507 [Plutella xylostella]|uniref:Integrase catalytic domain-containing protein n=1 Tax=Plutella xylostella TaxID=51655 RepID=A0ABQ7PQH8_PLUXY|nr:hypothetical protein JYU34_022507 [Plutella xylostella]